MATYDPDIEKNFPHIKQEGYDVTSPIDPGYNCIAWAAGENNLWYWPDPLSIYYWPNNIARECTLNAFIELYQSLGYEICSEQNVEADFEKIAIYVDSNNIPLHAARQLESGTWTSKLGPYKDIEHNTIRGLENSAYGKLGVVLRRKKS